MELIQKEDRKDHITPRNRRSAPERLRKCRVVPFDATQVSDPERPHNSSIMSTDPKRVNLKSTWQEHDIWYVIDRLQEEFRQQPSLVVHEIVQACQKEVSHTEGREKLLEAARKRMQSTL
jgi:hypothetical protein